MTKTNACILSAVLGCVFGVLVTLVAVDRSGPETAAAAPTLGDFLQFQMDRQRDLDARNR